MDKIKFGCLNRKGSRQDLENGEVGGWEYLSLVLRSLHGIERGDTLWWRELYEQSPDGQKALSVAQLYGWV